MRLAWYTGRILTCQDNWLLSVHLRTLHTYFCPHEAFRYWNKSLHWQEDRARFCQVPKPPGRHSRHQAVDYKQRPELLLKANDPKWCWDFPKRRRHLQDLFVFGKRINPANFFSSVVRIQKQNKICLCSQVWRNSRSPAGIGTPVLDLKVADTAHCDTRRWNYSLRGKDEATTVGWMGWKIHVTYRVRTWRVGYWK